MFFTPGSGHRPLTPARALAIAAYMLALAAFVTWPLAANLGDRSLAAEAEADLLLNQYLILWGAHAIVDADAELPHTNMFHPARNTYGYSDMPVASSILALPMLAAGATPDQIYGVLLLGSLVVGGLGVVALGRRLGLSTPAALAAATIYLANPAHVARYRNLLHISDHWLPWLLWALLGWLTAVGLRRTEAERAGNADRRVPAPWAEVAWRSALVAGLLSLHALTGSHNAVFGAVVGAATVGIHLCGAGLRPWGAPERRARIAAGAAAMVLITAAAVLPFFATYLAVYDELVSGRLGDPSERGHVLASAGAGARELLSGASDLWVRVDEDLGWPSEWIGTGRSLRAHLFPGLLPWLLALLGLAGLRPRTRASLRGVAVGLLDALAVWLAAAAAGIAWSGEYPRALPGAWPLAVAAVLATGARLALDRSAPHALTEAPAALRDRWRRRPDLVLVAVLLALCILLALGPAGGFYRVVAAIPGIGLIRAPSRFWLPGLIALACLAGFGVDALRRRLGRRAPLALAAALALFLAEAELVPLRIWHVPYPPDEVSEWLAAQPGDGAILEIPVDTSPPAEIRQMMRSTRHWKPLLAGYSGSQPPGYAERMERLRTTFPDPSALELLRSLDVGWVVVDRARLGPGEIEEIAAAGLEPAARFGNREIYRLR